MKRKIDAYRESGTLYQNAERDVRATISLLEKESRVLDRIWMHVDMDMFYAAVEIRDRPQLAKVPLAIGSESMVSTANYEARKFGVRSAMPGFIARKLCPSLVLVPCNMDKYRAASHKL